jgi:catechol 2,3-dioxygenase-like lactoylglutathione lyase family enzyme
MDDKRVLMSQRRRLLRTIGAGAAAAVAWGSAGRMAGAIAADAPDSALAVTTVNHLSYSSPNYKVTRDFYINLFGMRDVWDDGLKCQLDCGPEDAPNSFYMTESKPGVQPTVAHFSFGLPDFWKLTDRVKDDLTRRGLPGVHPDGEAGWFVNGPSGYVQHIVTVKDPAMFPGAAKPCIVARSEMCKDAYAAGVKNLASFPKPDGKGFKALYFHYIVLRVADVANEANFYRDVMRMRPVSQKPDEVALRFGENTLVIRPAGAGGKPSCNEFGFVVENYDQAKVAAELERRGIAFKPNPAGGLLFKDPNGLDIGIAGKA